VAEGTRAVRRAFKFRAYPTRPQEGHAVRLLADHCDLYNAALEERREAWRMRRVSVSYGMQSAQLREIRRADPHGQGRHSFTAQQQTLRRLNTAFAAFYTRARKGKAGYPRFKPYRRFSQVGFVAGDGAKWIPAAAAGWARAAFQAVGSVKVHQHRPVPGTVKFLQLKREHRRWYVIVIAETEPSPLPASDRSVGVDVGVARFLTLRTGRSSPTRSFSPPQLRRSPTCSGVRSGRAAGRGTARGSAASWRKNGGRSATFGATSTTRPPAPWWAPAT
jgi:putative transposase